MISNKLKQNFQTQVWDYYSAHGRHDLPWRTPGLKFQNGNQLDPYKIMVSEVMLQQTQVSRVIPKYLSFLEQFPDVETLATAELGDVLRAWSGLGYNRRAKFLHLAAQQVMSAYNGVFPQEAVELVALPGVGVNTAGAILAYAFDRPAVFLETNIRTVFFHHFFKDVADIPDRKLLELVRDTLPSEHPREWYWALMDYGTYLKATVGNLNKLSKTYVKQSTFQGSRRQLRGLILRQLSNSTLKMTDLTVLIPDERLGNVVADLLAEGLIHRQGEWLSL